MSHFILFLIWEITLLCFLWWLIIFIMYSWWIFQIILQPVNGQNPFHTSVLFSSLVKKHIKGIFLVYELTTKANNWTFILPVKPVKWRWVGLNVRPRPRSSGALRPDVLASSPANASVIHHRADWRQSVTKPDLKQRKQSDRGGDEAVFSRHDCFWG